MDKVLDSALLSSANKRKGILAIGAHPDDIELGCGASLARLAQKGIYIAAVVMTTGNSGTDGIIDRHEESRNALKILGCHQTIHLNFADTRAHLQLNEVPLSPLWKTSLKIKFLLMLKSCGYIPCMMPTAIRIISLFIKLQWLPAALFHKFSATNSKHLLSFMPQVFESVKEEYFTVKLAALKHKSQERRDYMRHDRLRAVAQFRGQQVNSELGEGFVIHKMIL